MPDTSNARRASRRRLAYLLGPAALAGCLAASAAALLAVGGTAQAAQPAAVADGPTPAPIPVPPIPPVGAPTGDCRYSNTSFWTTQIDPIWNPGSHAVKPSGEKSCQGLYIDDGPDGRYQGYYMDPQTHQVLPCTGTYYTFNQKTGNVDVCPYVVKWHAGGVHVSPVGYDLYVRAITDKRILISVQM
jgi:hypothetical protein